MSPIAPFSRVVMFLCLLLPLNPLASAERSPLQESLKDLEPHSSWIYDDLEKGFAEGKKTGKPLLVVLR